MKIVNIIGGLGNQMFQYAFAIALKEKNPQEEVFVDTSHFRYFFFKRYKGMNLHNGFEIDRVLDGPVLPQASWRKLIRVSYYMPNYLLSRIIRKLAPARKREYIEKMDFTYDPQALTQAGDVYYEGYWQAYQYFEDVKDDIRDAFQFRDIDSTNLKMIRLFHSGNSVSIHVRRGDYVSNKGFGGICELEYYQKAIDLVKSKIEAPEFYIFSNDIKWCEQNIKPLIEPYPCSFIIHNKGKDSYKDMELMSHCKTNIIANSSFSWWAAFLNHNQDAWVIAPCKWNNYFDKTDIYPTIWTKVE